MPRVFGQALRIGVAQHAVSLLRVSRWGAAAPQLLAEQACAPAGPGEGAEGAPFAAIGQALRDMLAQPALAGQLAGRAVTFVLDEQLVRLWQVAPPAGASRLADLEAAAALRFQALYGEAPGAWRILADCDAAAPFFAAAVPRALLALLEQVAAAHRLAVVGVEPHFIAAWNRWRRALKPGAWFGLVHDNLLILAALQERRLRAVRTLLVPHHADAYWLRQMLAREALLLELDAPQQLQLCGAAAPSWLAPAAAERIGCAALEPALGPEWSVAARLARSGSRA
ncbi:hypothetical protein ACFOLJ_01175 [Rugamonas sp. CCM 8940]|uniref:hypothetical protein n=1 Tax=Rugamonas sp. CCM 8940 TaxID=2765359 RepID=UPI0018F2B017|nr:hypothetical protein [Rugamonas sp. CCM 8940]MBJ7311423.1 hypothetical protein [Rugamonas sp. CCM 8940]